MARKNAYLFRKRFSEREFRDLLRLFALDITAARAAVLTGLHRTTALALYRLLRGRRPELAQRNRIPLQRTPSEPLPHPPEIVQNEIAQTLSGGRPFLKGETG